MFDVRVEIAAQEVGRVEPAEDQRLGLESAGSRFPDQRQGRRAAVLAGEGGDQDSPFPVRPGTAQ